MTRLEAKRLAPNLARGMNEHAVVYSLPVEQGGQQVQFFVKRCSLLARAEADGMQIFDIYDQTGLPLYQRP